MLPGDYSARRVLTRQVLAPMFRLQLVLAACLTEGPRIEENQVGKVAFGWFNQSNQMSSMSSFRSDTTVWKKASDH